MYVAPSDAGDPASKTGNPPRMRLNALNAFHSTDPSAPLDLSAMVEFYPPLAHPPELSPLSANILGLIVSGDIGGLTIYTDRHGRKIAFPKSPPKKPPSPAQIVQRARFKSAQAAYMAISSDQKARYETIVTRLALCMTGQNLYIHVALSHSFASLSTLERQAKISVTPPEPA